MTITAAGRAHVLKRINEAHTRSDLESFWNNRIGIPLKSEPEFKMAYYQRFKTLTPKGS